MSNFKAKMHQIRSTGEHTALPDPIAGIRGPTSKEKKGGGREWKGGEGGEGKKVAEMEGEKEKGMERDGQPQIWRWLRVFIHHFW